ncbi:MAG TPA: ABC transporter ATP-binding protein [Acetobacteraceae bacterium]|nr:ABC transporter ATP-binding protein [Acetobacteraceae bacterium]
MSDPLVQFEQFGVTGPRGAPALADFDLSLARGETVSLLGPPGAGKTLALHAVAGLARASAGRLFIAGRHQAETPPHQRNIALVERDPALFPAMTVAQNIAFPLRLRRVGRGDRVRRVTQLLTEFELAGKAALRPAALEARDALRVALARALSFRPTALLLDDPLPPLEHGEREPLIAEIRGLLRRFNASVLHATRDPREAFAMGDRIAVMDGGRLLQVGLPRAVYDEPVSARVAQLTGEANTLRGMVLGRDGNECEVRLDGGPVVGARAVDCGPAGSPCVVTVRPERVAVAAMQASELGEDAHAARLVEAVHQGDHIRLRVALGAGSEIVSRRPATGAPLPQIGGPAAVAWSWSQALAFRAGDGAAA